MIGFSDSNAKDSVPPSKQPQKRLCVNMTAPTVSFAWTSKFNLEGKINQSQVEIEHGATTKVYTGDISGKQIRSCKTIEMLFTLPCTFFDKIV